MQNEESPLSSSITIAALLNGEIALDKQSNLAEMPFSAIYSSLTFFCDDLVYSTIFPVGIKVCETISSFSIFVWWESSEHWEAAFF